MFRRLDGFKEFQRGTKGQRSSFRYVKASSMHDIMMNMDDEFVCWAIFWFSGVLAFDQRAGRSAPKKLQPHQSAGGSLPYRI
jgi:hypothetical protein